MNKSKQRLLLDLSVSGREGYVLPDLDVPDQELSTLIPEAYLGQAELGLPELTEPEVVRYFTQLSRKNHGVDVDFYPLGSCTMKYNPRVNEDLAALPGLARIHPCQPESTVQGALELIYELDTYLAEMAGLAKTSFQPAAGAHGELTGLLMIRAYHRDAGDDARTEIIIPDSAHGTNPASAMMAGFTVAQVPSDSRGGIDLKALKAMLGPHTAGLMLTNPNTLGLFDENVKEITRLVHQAGGLLYYDGANANAILGITRPGDMGFDIVHFNLHKTFSTPHGGGGPGSGPVVARQNLVEYLPGPVVEKEAKGYRFRHPAKSIGRVKAFYGNFGVLVKAYAYIRSLGPKGLRAVSENAVLNANYLMAQLKSAYLLPYDRTCMHEFVLSAERQKTATGVTALDIAKRLLDYGIHAPTVYFPLIVAEALMIEPTETESKETLDNFVQALKEIAIEAQQTPEKLKQAPLFTPVRRLDETRAARNPILKGTKK